MTLMIQGFQVYKVGYIYQSPSGKHIMIVNGRRRDNNNNNNNDN